MSEEKIEKYVPQYKKFGITPTVFVNEEKGEDMKMSPPIALSDFSDDKKSISSTQNTTENYNPADYALSVDDAIVSVDNKENIEEQILLLTMGEHINFPSEEVSLDRISVFKKINIKVGVFLEE